MTFKTVCRRGRLPLALLAALVAGAQAHAQTDPLPSWNEGTAKKAIIAFVQATTTPSGPKFVAPEARIATFDQDGTLWVEHPIVCAGDVLPRPRTGVGSEETDARAGGAIQDRALW
jgi:hypothetical protein